MRIFFSPKVASEAFESPNDVAGLQIKRSPMPLRVERSSTDMRDGFHGTVRLLLFEGGAKPVYASVTVHVERTRAVGDSVPIGETRIGGVASSARISRTIFPIAGVNANLTPFRRCE